MKSLEYDTSRFRVAFSGRKESFALVDFATRCAYHLATTCLDVSCMWFKRLSQAFYLMPWTTGMSTFSGGLDESREDTLDDYVSKLHVCSQIGMRQGHG